MCAKSEGLIYLKPPAMGGENEAKNGRDVDRVAEVGASDHRAVPPCRPGRRGARLPRLSIHKKSRRRFLLHSLATRLELLQPISLGIGCSRIQRKSFGP